MRGIRISTTTNSRLSLLPTNSLTDTHSISISQTYGRERCLNDHEIRIARYGVENATRFLALRLCISLENTSIKVKEKDKLVELLKALSDGK